VRLCRNISPNSPPLYANLTTLLPATEKDQKESEFRNQNQFQKRRHQQVDFFTLIHFTISFQTGDKCLDPREHSSCVESCGHFSLNRVLWTFLRRARHLFLSPEPFSARSIHLPAILKNSLNSIASVLFLRTKSYLSEKFSLC